MARRSGGAEQDIYFREKTSLAPCTRRATDVRAISNFYFFALSLSYILLCKWAVSNYRFSICVIMCNMYVTYVGWL